jgi:uncharacterized protein (TIGR03083 family)
MSPQSAGSESVSEARTWELIHAERASVADTLAGLSPGQWSEPSLCAGWTVQVAAGHILVGAEQTPARFMKGMAANLFRFNTMMDRIARRTGSLPPKEIIERLRVTTGTTNHPPAPVMAMLGEIVVHGEDIRRPLGLPSGADTEAVASCLGMFSKANFPVGGKKRIAGLRLVATDCDWSIGDGPEVAGPGSSLLLAMVGREAGLDGLTGPGVADLRGRMPAR